MEIKNLKKIIIPVIVVVVLLAVAGGLYYLSQKNKNKLTSEQASTKVMDFINSNLLQGQATATITGTSEESGVYKIDFTVNDQAYTFYVTEDGKILFTSGGPMPEESTAQQNGDQNTATQTDIPKQDKAQALLFVMAFCPYGNQAEDTMYPVYNFLKDVADIQLHYVIYSDYSTGYPDYCLDKENKYCSMHGIQELNQDVRELCVAKHQKDKLWPFVEAINTGCTAQNADTCWEGVANNLGIDTAKIKTCQKNEAITLLAQEVQLNQQYGISGSPDLVINGKEYTGARTSAGYEAGICAGFNTAPSECSQQVEGATTTAPAGECQ